MFELSYVTKDEGIEENGKQKCFHIMNSSALGICEFIQHLYEKNNSTIKKWTWASHWKSVSSSRLNWRGKKEPWSS